MKPLTILIDMDDTIENLSEAWVAYLNHRYGTQVSYNQVKTWDMTKAFPMLTKEQIYTPLTENELWLWVKPKPGAANTLLKLMMDGHRLFIVTASAYQTLPVKLDKVLFTYFPFLRPEQVIITTQKQMIKGDVLVDDNPQNLIGGDFEKILMTAPHNQTYQANQNGMYRVHRWEEAYEIILCLANNQTSTYH